MGYEHREDSQQMDDRNDPKRKTPAADEAPMRASETHTVFDPFLSKNVEISNKLIDRLRGKYAVGPMAPDGEPEFGWRTFPVPPIQYEAADMIATLTRQLAEAREVIKFYADDSLTTGYDGRSARTWLHKTGAVQKTDEGQTHD